MMRTEKGCGNERWSASWRSGWHALQTRAIGVVWVILISLCSASCWAQANLVPNPSFEEYDFCGHLPVGNGWALDWFVPPQGYSPDYFNSCSDLISGSVPDNTRGFQSPRTGNAYVGIFGFSMAEPDVREGITCELSDQLVAGEQYVFRAYFSLADNFQYSIRSLGYLLSGDPLAGSQLILAYVPTYSNHEVEMNDKLNWVLLTDTVLAIGGEQYLTIANFNPDSLSDTTYVDAGAGSIYDHAYYYIDDVSLIPLDSLLTVPTIGTVEVDVYPNPASGSVSIDFSASLEMTIGVVDVLGRDVTPSPYGYSPLQGGELLRWDVSQWPEGVYLITVTDEDGNRYAERLVVQH